MSKNIVENYIKSCNSKTQVLGEYINNRTPIKLKCECGKIYYQRFDNMKRNSYCKCNDCTFTIRGKKRRLNDIDEKFLLYGYELIGEYKWYNTSVLCFDKNGYVGYISLSNLTKHKKFANFPVKKHDDVVLYNLNKYLKDKNIQTRCILILNNKSFSQSKIYCRCSCGEYFSIKLCSLVYDNCYICPKCSKSQSNYEVIIESLLNEKNICYIKQYTFDDCKFKNKLRFDFFIPDINTIIEVDGEQHFTYKWGNKYDFNIKIRDKIKDKYCYDHGIRLIRISYKDIINDSYKNKLSFL